MAELKEVAQISARHQAESVKARIKRAGTGVRLIQPKQATNEVVVYPPPLAGKLVRLTRLKQIKLTSDLLRDQLLTVQQRWDGNAGLWLRRSDKPRCRQAQTPELNRFFHSLQQPPLQGLICKDARRQFIVAQPW